MDIDELHEHYRDQLPEWAPYKEGVPVLMMGRTEAPFVGFGWADKCSNFSRGNARAAWDYGDRRIIAILGEDESTWVEVPVAERERLGDNLVGCRVWSDRGDLRISTRVKTSRDGLVGLPDGSAVFTNEPLRVHPADLAAAREKAGPTPPTTWDEWEEGAKWVDSEGDPYVKRDGALFLANPDWSNIWSPESHFRDYGPFHAPTEDQLDRARRADEVAGWAPPTSPNRWRDRDVWSLRCLLCRRNGDRIEYVTTGEEPARWAWSSKSIADVIECDLRPLTAEERARVKAADEAERVPEEPTGDVIARDAEGCIWVPEEDHWASDSHPTHVSWGHLHRNHGPLTIYRQETP